MFSRSTDRTSTPQQAAPLPPPAGVRDVSAPPGPPPPAVAPPVQQEMSVVARADRVEGTLRVQDALRVQGTVQGTVEARTVFVDEGARLHADVTADEVVIAGEYSGKLVCRQRLEVRASGSIAGQFETVRLMLHEGASVDGELRMLKQPTANGEPARGGATIRGGRGDAPARAPAAPAAAAPAADQSVQQG